MKDVNLVIISGGTSSVSEKVEQDAREILGLEDPIDEPEEPETEEPETEDTTLTPNPDSDFVFDATTGTIKDYVGTRKDVVIPEKINGVTVTEIQGRKPEMEIESAFINKGITSISIPKSITTIGNYAFYRNELTEVQLSDSITHIGQWVFAHNKIEKVTLSNSLTSIGPYAFANNKITELTIPNNVTSILEGAFELNELKSVKLLSNIEYLAENAFDTHVKLIK